MLWSIITIINSSVDRECFSRWTNTSISWQQSASRHRVLHSLNTIDQLPHNITLLNSAPHHQGPPYPAPNLHPQFGNDGNRVAFFAAFYSYMLPISCFSQRLILPNRCVITDVAESGIPRSFRTVEGADGLALYAHTRSC